MGYLHQSTEVVGTGENLTQGSWYTMMNKGGIAGMVYHGDIATLFHVYFLGGFGQLVGRSIFLRSVDISEESGRGAIMERLRIYGMIDEPV